ncbi:MAG TPA: methylcrotonoyl-CoA carboxylase [Rhodospirillaceae bacterium]|nr:methylcrotonoyl-CoA carboxylase [Rhodospirillaceae bacterium]
MPCIESAIVPSGGRFAENKAHYDGLLDELRKALEYSYSGGGQVLVDRHHKRGKILVRERIDLLVDPLTSFLELSPLAAWQLYNNDVPAAGIVTGIGIIQGVPCMIIANDATVKAGAYFETSLKKTIRLQEIAIKNNIPIIYLVDSAGVFLPMQDQVFPDEGHFGKIFYNNARISSMGIHQIACVMGPCVAGGAYLPVMCDKYIITEGSNMFLAAPALVKAAIGQEIDAESLGGATTHSSISGTADYHEKNDYESLKRIRNIVEHINLNKSNLFSRKSDYIDPKYNFIDILKTVDLYNKPQYDIIEIIIRLSDNSEFYEYKENYGKTLVCGHCSIGGFKVGIVANQKKIVKDGQGKLQLGGVIYNDSADKAARFIMNCNQDKIPIIFLHDVNGFMVGKDSEWSGIAKDGAKMVNAVSNSTVPKISVIIGGSYGAGNYAMCGRAYNPNFIYAWPNAKIAVMGGEQAANTLASIKLSKVSNVDDVKKNQIKNDIKKNYDKQSNINYAGARMWIDEIIDPEDTRLYLIRSLELINNIKCIDKPNFGVMQV